MKTKAKKAVVVLLILLFPFFLFACKTGSSDNGAVALSDAAPDAAPETVGTFTINTSGADGGPDGGSGGNGGSVDIYMDYGSLGPLQVMASGVADASFTPRASAPNLGDNPLILTADTTITSIPVPGAEPAAGTPYLVEGSSDLRISDGDGDLSNEDAVTGISVVAGVTLTLELNYILTAEVLLDNDIDNDGTITTVDRDGDQRGNLSLDLYSYHGNGTIDTSGTLDGQSGGYVQINSGNSFFNNGRIDTSGADSTARTAGNGGYVEIYAYYGIENTGDITTDGGAATGGGDAGGDAGYLDFAADFNLNNSGNLSCRGGDGVNGGGYGNWIQLYAGDSDFGDLHNSGNLDTSGGDSAADDGGSGGDIEMYAYGGYIVNSGNLTTKGGDNTDPSSDAGDGGSVYLEVSFQNLPARDVLFSGNVDASGGLAVTETGATGRGGSGGNFEIYAEYENYPLGQRIALLGYSGIDASGGDGNFTGDGESVQLYCYPGYDDLAGFDTAGCSITNEADINTAGGSVVVAATNIPANGGNGGDVYMETIDGDDYGEFYLDIEKVVNSGDIDTSGGDNLEADSSAGGAGSVWIWGYNGVTNSGNITARGGDDLGTDGGTTGFGNDGNDLQLYAELGPVSNSGALSTDGGDGEYSAGDASVIELFGPEVSNSGALAANGGNADPSLADSTGGDGAEVNLDSPDGLGITQTGTVTNHGGTGTTAGSDGDYYLGGVLQ